jgi:hypothetical protein
MLPLTATAWQATGYFHCLQPQNRFSMGRPKRRCPQEQYLPLAAGFFLNVLRAGKGLSFFFHDSQFRPFTVVCAQKVAQQSIGIQTVKLAPRASTKNAPLPHGAAVDNRVGHMLCCQAASDNLRAFIASIRAQSTHSVPSSIASAAARVMRRVARAVMRPLQVPQWKAKSAVIAVIPSTE